MNKQIKLLKVVTATKYAVNLNSDDFETLWCFHAGTDEDVHLIHEFFYKRIGDAFHSCDFNFSYRSLDVWIDYDLDCDLVRKDVEKTVSEYFKLALENSRNG